MRDIESLRSIVQTWQLRRKPLAEKFTMDGAREFAETHNALCKQMIAHFETDDPEFFSALTELATHAQTLVTGGKFFINKRDRTND